MNDGHYACSLIKWWSWILSQSVSHQTIRLDIKKNELKPWQKKEWCIPPEQDAPFVCQMKEVLDIYKKPYDPQYPLVCMDEMFRPN